MRRALVPKAVLPPQAFIFREQKSCTTEGEHGDLVVTVEEQTS